MKGDSDTQPLLGDVSNPETQEGFTPEARSHLGSRDNPSQSAAPLPIHGQREPDQINESTDDAVKEKEAEDEAAPQGHKLQVALITLMTFFLGCGGNFHSPLMTQYAYQVYTEVVYGNASDGVHISRHPCVNTSSSVSSNNLREVEVQDKTSDLLLRLDLVSGSLAVVVNMLLGSYSDWLGRRFVLLVPILGHFLRNASAPVIIYWDLGLPALYAGYVMDGLSGGTSGILLGIYLYIADITGKRQRTLGMSVIETALGLTSAATNIGAGWLIQDTGFLYASLLASVFLLAAAAIVLCLPETVPRDRKRTVSPLVNIRRVLSIYTSRGQSPYQRCLLVLGVISFMVLCLPDFANSKIKSLYLMDRPFCWGSLQIGVFMSVSDAVSRVGSFLLMLVLHKRLRGPHLAILGSASFMAGDVLMGMARNDLMVYLVPVAYLAMSVLSPAVRSMMSQNVAADKQGALFASLAVVESVSYALSQLVFLSVYQATLTFMASFVFFAVAGFHLVVLLIYMVYACILRQVLMSRVTTISVQR